MGVVPSALKDFEQDEITNQERFPCNDFLQFVGRRRAMPRRYAIQTELSTRITTDVGGPGASP
jgi:hypothetical protein